jgi:hypothetical protein
MDTMVISTENYDKLKSLTAELLFLAAEVKNEMEESHGNYTEEYMNSIAFGVAGVPWAVASMVAKDFTNSDTTVAWSVSTILAEDIYEEQWGAFRDANAKSDQDEQPDLQDEK